MKHHWMMIIGCVLPLILIFLLPLFGVGTGLLLFLFLILCFGLHLVMMVRGGHKHDENDKKNQGGSHGKH
jgi:hypothetical protein